MTSGLIRKKFDSLCHEGCYREYTRQIENCPCHNNCQNGCENCSTFECPGMTLVDPETPKTSRPNINDLNENIDLELSFTDEFEEDYVTPYRWRSLEVDRGLRKELNFWYRKKNLVQENGLREFSYKNCINYIYFRFYELSPRFGLPKMQLLWFKNFFLSR